MRSKSGSTLLAAARQSRSINIGARQRVNANTAEYAVQDEYGEVQPFGKIALDPAGNYSLTILLRAGRKGNDLNGRQYTILFIGLLPILPSARCHDKPGFYRLMPFRKTSMSEIANFYQLRTVSELPNCRRTVLCSCMAIFTNR